MDKSKDIEYRTRVFEQTVLDMVEHICEELINDPEGVDVQYKVGLKKASLTVIVPKGTLQDVKGKRSDKLAAIKKLAISVANIHDFYLTLEVKEG